MVKNILGRDVHHKSTFNFSYEMDMEIMRYPLDITLDNFERNSGHKLVLMAAKSSLTASMKSFRYRHILGKI